MKSIRFGIEMNFVDAENYLLVKQGEGAKEELFKVVIASASLLRQIFKRAKVAGFPPSRSRSFLTDNIFGLDSVVALINI